MIHLMLCSIVQHVHFDQAAKCGYVLLLMAVFWMTEALPIAVTSLLPLVLFPLMGIMKSIDVSMQYMKVRH